MWFGPPERNTLRPRENGVVLLKSSLTRVSLSPGNTLRLPEPFIAQGQTITTSPKGRQVASGQVKPYTVGHHWPAVANDVFNGVGMSGLVPYVIAHGQQYVAMLLRHWAL
jgi:hypothetical protein